MATKAGQVVINISAGTAQMISDLEKGKTKFKEFGQAGVSGIQASSAALRELEGNFGHNIRAVENFLSKVLGLGDVLKTVFPLVGGMAFAGLLVDLGKKLDDFVEKWQQTPERMAGAFNTINLRLRTTNDELALSNVRLENEIAKLEGKPQNGLAEALMEARVQADKLAESLASDLDAFGKLLKEEHDNPLVGYFKGEANDAGIHNTLVGKSGFGGLRAVVADADVKPEDKIAAINKALAENADAYKKATTEQRQYEAASKETREAANPIESAEGIVGLLRHSDQSKLLEELKEAKRQLDGMLQHITLSQTHDADTTKRDDLRAKNANAKIERPADDAIRALESQLKADTAKGNAASGDTLQRAVASGNASADVKIEAVRKALEKTHGTLSALQQAQIRSLEIGKALRTMETAWEDSQRNLNRTLGDRVTAQERLTAAVGKGYEAQKAAVVEDQLQQAMGERYNKPAYADEQNANRAKIAAAFEADHGRQIAVTIDKLGDEIALTKALTEAQEKGAAAVRLAAEAFREKKAAEDGASPAEVASMRAKFEADEALKSAEATAKIREETAVITARTAAVMQGADAQRRAALDVKYGQMATAGANPGEIDAERAKDAAMYQAEIADQAARAGNEYVNGITALSQQLAFLMAARKTQGDSLALQISMRSVEDERLKLAAAYALQQRTALAGVRSFFLEMQTQAESSAKIIYDSLNKALDDTSANMAKLLTGQQTSWGQMFRSIGEGMVQSSVKSMMQAGIGKLGEAFGINISSGKADGSKERPFYMVQTDPKGAGNDVLGNVLGKFGINTGNRKPDGTQGNPLYVKDAGGSGGGGLLGAFSSSGGGGGGGGESIGTMDTAMADGGGMASGGFVTPEKAYMVGEEGREMISRTSGYVTRSTELARMMGENSGGGDIHIDARGTDPALTEARVRQAIAQTHGKSVGAAVKMNEERAKRRPGGK